MPGSDPALILALALAAGIVSQSVARHLRIPGIVVLLAVGVLLGPDVSGVIRPDALGGGLQTVVGMGVAIILFEGGLALNIGQLRREAATIRRLVTLGVLVTAVGGALAARTFMGWDWSISILFGTLVTVTGPTVVTPLLRRVRIKRNLRTILEAEGVFIDPIGAIVAVVALEVVLTTTPASAAIELLGLPTRLGVGFGLGLAGGYLIGVLLRFERLVPEGLENVVTLALVLALFEVSDAVVAESGILAVAVAGLVVGNMETRVGRELMEFKEQLTLLFLGLLFVLLAADVRLTEVTSLGWGGIATVVALIVVVRPLDVAVSTAGSSLGRADRAYLAWLAPRGIVAAAVASLFAEELAVLGFEGATGLRALVFLVIAVTVAVQGLSSGVVASLLGVRRREERGYLVVGANAVGRALAGSLMDGGEEAVLVDSNASECSAAEADGFPVVFGNARDPRTLLQADVEGRKGIVAVTPNSGVNLLLARDVGERFGLTERYVTLNTPQVGVSEEQVREVGGGVLFGGAVNMGEWAHRLLHGAAEVQLWSYAGAGEVALVGPAGESPSWAAIGLLPLAVRRNHRVVPADDRIRVRPGDSVYFARSSAHGEESLRWLEERGWKPSAEPLGAGVGRA